MYYSNISLCPVCPVWPRMCFRPLPVRHCLVLVTSRWWRQRGSKKFISQISRLQTTQHFRPIAGGKATYFCIDKLISIYFLTFNVKDKENYMKLYKTLLVRFNFSGNPHFIITVSVWYLPWGSGAHTPHWHSWDLYSLHSGHCPPHSSALLLQHWQLT